MRAASTTGLRVRRCDACRATGIAEEGGEAYRCASCGGGGWTVTRE